MADEQDVGVVFPLAGLETTCEFGRQPVDTTADALNVRTSETITNRMRGGSRPGLSKYIAETVVGDNPVQHLNVIVDPQTPALSAEVDDGDMDDPSTNNLSLRNFGRRIRRGGGGRVPSRRRPGTTQPIEFVQKYRVQPGTISSVYELQIDNPPGVQNLLVVVVRTEKLGGAAELVESVKNELLNEFVRVGGSGYTAETTGDFGGGATTESVSVWTRVANAGVHDQVIRVFPGASAIYEIIVLEYRYASATSPVSNHARASSDAASDPWVIGPLDLNDTAGQLVLAAYTQINTVATVNSSGYVARFGVSGDPNSTAANMVVIDRGTLSGAGPESPTVGDTLVPRPFAGIAIALTK